MGSYKPPYTITSKILTLSTQISEELTKIEYDEKNIISPKLRKISRIKTLAGTLEIEGNFLGEEKITAILEGKKVLGTVMEVAEAEGAIEAYKELENYQFDSLDDLLKAHKILMDSILKTAGNFRMVNVGVGDKDGVTHVAPPPLIVPKLMGELFDWLKESDEHLLIKSCVFHYEFEFIHPFSDGNGRIGRLWQTVILKSYKELFSLIPIESVVRDNQKKYYDALENSGSVGESTPFIEFMLEIILKSLKEFSKQHSKSNQKSNYKSDQKILSILKKNNKITIRELCEKTELSESGVKKIIKKLKDDNLLKRIGSLKGGHWEIIE